MIENKRFIAKPETVSYEDTKTGEIFRPKYEMGFYKLLNAMNDLADENEQLKERNQRQAKHLAELYELMAKKDWEALTGIIDDFCSCESQLKREWGCYDD